MNRVQFFMRIALAAGISLAMSCSAYFDEAKVGSCGDKYYRSNSDLLCEGDAFVAGARCWVGDREQLYNPSKQFCQSNAIKDLCGTQIYAVNQRCGAGNVIEAQCGSEWYKPSLKEQYCRNGNALAEYGSVSIGDREYKTIEIGPQTWMAENLNYNVSGSVCYENKEENCDKYGRLYNLEAAKNVCPSGWLFPNDQDFYNLGNLVGGNSGNKLRTVNGWQSYNYGEANEDTFGFAALPGGIGHTTDYFSDIEYEGNWWSYYNGNASGNRWTIKYNENYVGSNSISSSSFLSVRCIKD
jgi:uncharacterized protein (TIGR02145 family)